MLCFRPLRTPMTTALTLGLLFMSTASAPASPGQTPAAAPGRGTSSLEVTALHVDASGVGGIGVVVTRGHATLDHERARLDGDGALADVAAVRADLVGGTSLVFPDPPVESKTSRGRDVESKGDASVAVPPVPAVPAAPGGPGAGGSPVAPGSFASGTFLPAKVESWRDESGAGALATSQVADLDVLSGLSHVEGAGPGEHRSWSDPDEVGATARAFGLRSATLFELGPTLDRLGYGLDQATPAALLALARALGLEGAVAGLGLGSPVPPVLPQPVRDQVVELLGSAPLLAVTDVSGSVEAVASVQPNGDVDTTAEAGGSVGSVSVGGIRLNGFDAQGTADDWNLVEADVAAAMNQVLGSVIPGAHDLARVRVMPLNLQRTDILKDGYALAEARLRLLDVSIRIPPAPSSGSSPAVPGSDLLDEIEDELPGGGLPAVPAVPGGGGGLPAVPGLPGGVTLGALEPDEAIGMELGSLAATAEHTRPGVTPTCAAACNPDGSPLNAPWSPTEGFDATAEEAPGAAIGTGTGTTNNPLPKTGGAFGAVEVGAGMALGGAAVAHGVAQRARRRVGRQGTSTTNRGST